MYKKLIFSFLFFSIFLFSCATQNEMEVKTIQIGPQTATCDAGVMVKECLQVKWTEEQRDWELFYNNIIDFEYEPGYLYTLVVKIEEIENPPADASSLRYHLVEQLDKQAICPKHLSKEEVISLLKAEGLILQPKEVSEEEIAKTPSYQPKATFLAEECRWIVKSSTYGPVTYEGDCANTNGCTPELILSIEVHAQTGEVIGGQEERKLHPNYE